MLYIAAEIMVKQFKQYWVSAKIMSNRPGNYFLTIINANHRILPKKLRTSPVNEGVHRWFDNVMQKVRKIA